MPKILLILSIVFMLGSAVLGYLNKQNLTTTRDATTTATKRAEAAESSVTKAKKELSATNEKLTAESARAATLEQSVAAKEADLAKATTDLTNAQADLTAKNAALEEAQKQIKEIQDAITHNSSDPNKPATEGPNLSELQGQIAAMDAEKKVLGEKLAASESKVADLNHEIERRKNAILAKGLEGQIVAVNQAWGFVVLSLGDRKGMVPNAEMVVMRDGERIGKVKITSVESSNSIADIIGASVEAGQRIMPGDQVIYGGN